MLQESCENLFFVHKKQKRPDVLGKKAARTLSKNKQKRSDTAKKGALTRRINKNKRTIPNDLKDRIGILCSKECVKQIIELTPDLIKPQERSVVAKNPLEYDHIVPFSKGGKTTYNFLVIISNLITG